MCGQVSVPKQEEKKERSNSAFTAHRNHEHVLCLSQTRERWKAESVRTINWKKNARKCSQNPTSKIKLLCFLNCTQPFSKTSV